MFDLSRLAFPFTDEQLSMGAVARDFAVRQLAPGAKERDRTGKYPREHLGQLAELGLLAMKVPVEEGGAGADNVAFVLALEAVAESCTSTAVILASSNLCSKILSEHATPAQKERWLTPYAQGRLGPAAFALSEPNCGSDAAALTTRATLDGDAWVLDGQKMWITSGAEAGLTLVFARTDGKGPAGISCFVVEKGTPGFTAGHEEDKMGHRASGTVPLFFDGCRIPKDHLVGARGQGYFVALSALGAGRAGISGLALGIAEAAFAAGLSYAQNRKAFGQLVSDFQNTRMVLATCRAELDAAWLLALRAARLLDRGDRATAETSIAKLYSTEVCGRVVDAMLQLHGGAGYSKDSDIERLYRDARVTRIYEGTNEIQRLVVANELLKG